MGDDPYDFEIAIPSAKAGGGGRGEGTKGTVERPGRVDTDDDDDNASPTSDISLSDSEESDRSKRRPQPIAGSSRVSTTKGTGAAKSNALDKAKSFLSKYSTKSSKPTPAKARRGRVELSLDDDDDDDFSLDSSGEEVKKPKSKTIVVAQTKTFLQEDRADKDRTGAQPLAHLSTNRANSNDGGSEDEDEERKRSYRTPEGYKQDTRSESEDDLYCSEDEAKVVSTTPIDVTQPKVQSNAIGITSKPAQTTPSWQNHASRIVVDDDDDEVHSVASQSEFAESVENTAESPSQHFNANNHPTIQHSKTEADAEGAESGVYGDEEFEDESTAIGDGHSSAERQVETRVVRQESNFDYSMDFSEDPGVKPFDLPNGVGQETTSTDENLTGKEDEQSGRSEERSAFLDSENDSPHKALAITVLSAGDEDVMVGDRSQSAHTYNEDRFDSESFVAAPDPTVKSASTHEPRQSSLPGNQSRFRSSAPEHNGLQIQNSHLRRQEPVDDNLGCGRTKVTIVREYDQPQRQVEMRDASTQCTGNHAGIQTDLTPDGMHSLSEKIFTQSISPSVPPHVAPPNAPTSEERSSSQRNRSLPPPPPVLSFNEAYDTLPLPETVSMSLYKNQLLALQRQIQQKKEETERLFRERLTFRYTSLNTTEQYLNTNRPSKIPLWQALMRVDPSLDEAKAREIAHMASDTA